MADIELPPDEPPITLELESSQVVGSVVIQGARGLIGPQGEQGIQGEAGPQGIPGESTDPTEYIPVVVNSAELVTRLGDGTLAVNFASLMISADAGLHRDAAGILAQRDGAIAQGHRIYNTYTDDANYERFGFEWSTNQLKFNVEAAGTGTLRDIKFAGNGSIHWEIIGSGGVMRPGSDNAIDLGASARRIRNAYFGTSVITPKVTLVAAASQNARSLEVSGNSYGIGFPNAAYVSFIGAGSIQAAIVNNGLHIMSGARLEFGPTGAGAGVPGVADAALYRDEAGVVAQRSGVTAQASRLYNTYTDASNYERAFLRWSSNTLEIGTEAAGTGTPRNVVIRGGTNASTQGSITLTTGVVKLGYSVQLAPAHGSAAQIMFYTPSDSVLRITNATGNDFNRLQFGGTNSSFPALKRVATGLAAKLADDSDYGPFSMKRLNLAALETAPPAAPTAGVTLYTEDNGAGKARLMALFPTGVAQQVAIEP